MAVRAQVISIAQQLQRLSLQEDEVIALVKQLGINDSDIVSILKNLLLGEETSESTILDAVQQVLQSVQQVASELQSDTAQIMQALVGPPTDKGAVLALSLPDDGTQQANYVLQINDATGQMAQLVGPEAWSIDNTTDFALNVADDGLSGSVKTVNQPATEGATCTLTVSTPTSADGSTGPIVDTDTLTVVAGAPSSAALTGTLGPVSF